MFKKIKKAFFIIFLSWLVFAWIQLIINYRRVYLSHKEAEVQLALQQKLNTLTVPQLIDYVAGESKHKELAKKIVFCESSNNKNAIHYNDGGKGKHSVGAWQFQKTTFDSWSQKMGEQLDYYSPLDQSKVGMYMLEHNQAYQWSCSRMI